MRCALVLLTLAGCATAAPRTALPERAAVLRALDHWDNQCRDMALSDPQIDCVYGPDRQVGPLRCRGAGIVDGRRRVLCGFSGRWVWPSESGRGRRFGPLCAYLSYYDDGVWLVDSFPDPNRCAL